MALSVRNVVFLPFYYAKDTKIFAKHGLNVELIQMRSDLQLAGLASGKSISRRLVRSRRRRHRQRFSAESARDSLSRAVITSLVSPAGVSSAKELEGKTVAVSRIGSKATGTVRSYLKVAGPTPRK